MLSNRRIFSYFGSFVLVALLIGVVVWRNSMSHAETPAVVETAPAKPAVEKPKAESAEALQNAAANHQAAIEPSKALEEYLQKDDTTCTYKIRRQFKIGEGKLIELILTSQTWHEIAWKHQLYMYLPAKVLSTEQAIMLVDGGAWKAEFENAAEAGDEKLPTYAALMTKAADAMQCPLIVLRQVPQQPIFDNLYEDQIISHTFAEYLRTGDRDWPLLLPMVKSAVKAMTAAQEVAKKEWKITVEQFMVTGASKRGWTTWLTGAIDKRVNAIAPMVIDVLNMAPQMAQQFRYYGMASEQIRDYTERGLLRQFLTARGQELVKIVDPFVYRAKIQQPKMIILATNDRYWTVDALNLYYNELQGEKHICYIPNSGHTITDHTRLVGALGSLYQQAAGKVKIPNLDWKYEDTGTGIKLTIKASEVPREVLFWKAESKTRDFREMKFVSQKVDFANGQCTIEQSSPDSGYMAVYCEAQFPRDPFPCPLTTTMRVLGGEKK